MNTDATDDSPRRGRYVPSVSGLLAAWSEKLASAGVPSPQHDARALAAHVLDVRPGQLVLLSSLDPDDVSRIEKLVERRATREPLQYITGSVGFLGLDLLVGPGVFVPRPETELLADHVVQYLRAGRADHFVAGRSEHLPTGHRDRPVNSEASSGSEVTGSKSADDGQGTPSALYREGRIQVVDLCSGSGAIGLAVACNVDYVACVGVENSPIASDYARRNGANCHAHLAARHSSFEVVEADAIAVADADLVQLQGTVDVVVCNPPYVPDAAIPREAEVRKFDPAEALYGGPDGLDIIRKLVDTAAVLLRPGGLLAMEHADSQGEDSGIFGVPGVLRDHMWTADEESQPESAFQRVVDHLDLTDRPRFTIAIRSA